MQGDSAGGQEEQLFSQPSSQVIIATTVIFLSINAVLFLGVPAITAIP